MDEFSISLCHNPLHTQRVIPESAIHLKHSTVFCRYLANVQCAINPLLTQRVIPESAIHLKTLYSALQVAM